jgi:hypothetical protein
MEKVFQVKEWSFKVNSSLFAMIIVDSWTVYRGAVEDGHGLSQNEYYMQLASELIENRWDGSSLRERKIQRQEGIAGTERPRSCLSAHLTPTKPQTENQRRRNTSLHIVWQLLRVQEDEIAISLLCLLRR